MSILLIIIHIIVSVALIMIVLLQTGKGADIKLFRLHRFMWAQVFY